VNTVITDQDVEVKLPGEKSSPLVWVIGEDCLYDLPVKEAYVEMFLSSDSAEDASAEYPEHEGIAVRFTKNTEVLYDFLTSEYFGSILLSSPLVLDLRDYPYGRYVMSPYAKFDGEKFIITNQDVTELAPWHPIHSRAKEDN
jgi:hypothetical protein